MLLKEKKRFDYYAFGMEMPGRSIGSDFAYNFNGKRTDKWNGDNGSYLDFGARIHDARLGRFFTPDPAKSGWSFEAPYIFAGNTPIQAIDENGEKIYFVNENGVVTEATTILKATKAGQILLNYYEKSNTHDIYIKFADKPLDNNEADALGATYTLNDNDISTNWFNSISKVNLNSSDEFDKQFNGMDISKSKGRTISLIALNYEPFKKGTQYDKYSLAFVIYHEIAAHILIGLNPTNKGKDDHDVFGNKKFPSFIGFDGKRDNDYSFTSLVRRTAWNNYGTLADVGLKQLYRLYNNEKKLKNQKKITNNKSGGKNGKQKSKSTPSY